MKTLFLFMPGIRAIVLLALALLLLCVTVYYLIKKFKN